jgi:hypothetical protein
MKGLTAFCGSSKCNGNHIYKMSVKENVVGDKCPDCNSAIVWSSRPKRRKNFAGQKFKLAMSNSIKGVKICCE